MICSNLNTTCGSGCGSYTITPLSAECEQFVQVDGHRKEVAFSAALRHSESLAEHAALGIQSTMQREGDVVHDEEEFGQHPPLNYM